MSEPLFSILLPTKNRAVILSDAIRSVLRQTCGDFELIVSDNDDSPTASREVVEQFSDARLRYHRTSGRLPMHENWETALTLARGRYVLVLEDKQRLTVNALETLRRLLLTRPDAVITYPFIISQADDLPPIPEATQPVQVASAEILRRFCQFDETVYPLLPRGLNSCAPRQLLLELKAASPTGAVFSFVAPDYSQCYQVLSRVDSVLHLPAELIFVPMSLRKKGNFSNGAACMMKTPAAQRWFDELPVGIPALIEHVPVKTHWIPYNLVLHDFFVFVRRPDFEPPWNWVRYHGQCLFNVLLGKLWGADIRPELHAITASLRREGLWFSLRVAADVARRIVTAAINRLKSNRRF